MRTECPGLEAEREAAEQGGIAKEASRQAEAQKEEKEPPQEGAK